MSDVIMEEVLASYMVSDFSSIFCMVLPTLNWVETFFAEEEWWLSILGGDWSVLVFWAAR